MIFVVVPRFLMMGLEEEKADKQLSDLDVIEQKTGGEYDNAYQTAKVPDICRRAPWVSQDDFGSAQSCWLDDLLKMAALPMC